MDDDRTRTPCRPNERDGGCKFQILQDQTQNGLSHTSHTGVGHMPDNRRRAADPATTDKNERNQGVFVESCARKNEGDQQTQRKHRKPEQGDSEVARV